MGTVINPPFERFVPGVELVGIPQSESGEVELRHRCKFAIAPYVEPDAEDAFDEEQGGGLGLRTEAFGIGYQQGWPDVEVGAEREQGSRRKVIDIPEIVAGIAGHAKVPQHEPWQGEAHVIFFGPVKHDPEPDECVGLPDVVADGGIDGVEPRIVSLHVADPGVECQGEVFAFGDPYALGEEGGGLGEFFHGQAFVADVEAHGGVDGLQTDVATSPEHCRCAIDADPLPPADNG